MQQGKAAKVGRVIGALAIGGGGTLVATWGLGRLMQGESVIKPSRRIYDYCRRHRSATLSRRLDPVTTIGGYSVVGSFSLLVGGMIAYERRDWRPVPLLVGGVMSEVWFQKALKQLVKGTFPPAEASIGPPGDYPSGGAARTVITFGLLAHMLSQRVIWLAAMALIAAQGGSRLYLGRHWPEDVVGGWVLGYLILKTLVTVDKISS
jgi:hypothetical protein